MDRLVKYFYGCMSLPILVSDFDICRVTGKLVRKPVKATGGKLELPTPRAIRGPTTV